MFIHYFQFLLVMYLLKFYRLIESHKSTDNPSEFVLSCGHVIRRSVAMAQDAKLYALCVECIEVYHQTHGSLELDNIDAELSTYRALQEAHRKRHIDLHTAVNELVADYLAHRLGLLPSKATVKDLLEWSFAQTVEASDLNHFTTTRYFFGREFPG